MKKDKLQVALDCWIVIAIQASKTNMLKSISIIYLVTILFGIIDCFVSHAYLGV
jgi:hypothetical protein